MKKGKGMKGGKSTTTAFVHDRIHPARKTRPASKGAGFVSPKRPYGNGVKMKGKRIS